MARRTFRAFTLIELMVVVIIIVILISILVPSVTFAREQSRRANCAANLRNLFMAFRGYAIDHQDNVPQTKAAGNWMWDQAYATRDVVVKYYLGGTGTLDANYIGNTTNQALVNYRPAWRHIWFCPSYTDEDIDGIWTFQDPSAANTYGVTGYALLNQRRFNGDSGGGYATAPTVASPPAANFGVWTYQNHMTTLTPYPAGLSAYPAFNETLSDATMPFGADATLQESNSALTTYLSFSYVTGGGANNSIAIHRTSHMAIFGGALPAGGNIIFFDGHVDWRPFSSMYRRTSGPYFWW